MPAPLKPLAQKLIDFLLDDRDEFSMEDMAEVAGVHYNSSVCRFSRLLIASGPRNRRYVRYKRLYRLVPIRSRSGADEGVEDITGII